MTFERAHQCERKRRYSDEPLALATAMARVEQGAPALKAYRCKFCGGWHLAKLKDEDELRAEAEARRKGLI